MSDPDLFAPPADTAAAPLPPPPGDGTAAIADLDEAELDEADLGEDLVGVDDEAVEDERPATVYESSDEWVESWLMRWSRPPDRWCANWTEHPYGAVRLHALWQSWEAANLEGGGAMSSWWIVHHDAHMAVLGGAKGPFARCQPKHVADDTNWRR